jgi:hypothetical protein
MKWKNEEKINKLAWMGFNLLAKWSENGKISLNRKSMEKFFI